MSPEFSPSAMEVKIAQENGMNSHATAMSIKAFNKVKTMSPKTFIAKMPERVKNALSIDAMGNLVMDENAAMDVKTIIGLGIGIYVLAAILPGALSSFFNASTAGWDVGSIALWGIIPLVVIVAVVLTYIKASD